MLVTVPTKGSVCGQRTSRAPQQPCCSLQKLSWQQGAWREAAWPVPVWQARPIQPGGQEHLSGKTQLPPFWHGTQQRAAGPNKQRVIGQLWGSQAPSLDTMDTCTHPSCPPHPSSSPPPTSSK